MASQCLFQGNRQDILSLISRVEALRPEIAESELYYYGNPWDALAADLAASCFTGEVLRWYEGLDVTTQESWTSLRASLLATFVTYRGDSSDDDPDDSRVPRTSCLVAWPAPPPLTVPGSQAGQTDRIASNGALLSAGPSAYTTPRMANGAYTAKISQSRMQRFSAALGIGKAPPTPAPTQVCLASHFIIDLQDCTPPQYLFGWKRIEVELPPPGQAETTIYRISKSVPLSAEQLNYLQVGFRLVERPPLDETVHVGISYGGKRDTKTFSQGHDLAPDPLGTSDTPSVYITPFTGFYCDLKPGMSIHSSMAIAHWSLNAAFDHPHAVVEWRRGA